MMSAKTKKSIPVVVCEFHQEVLEFIHRYIAKKRLPFNNIKMIHFDSHPDLAFPDQLLADDCYCKEKMYNDLDIADWILPLAYAGHLGTLVWIKPPWAKQIDDVLANVKLGKHRDTGKLRVNCTEEYFLEDCSYAPENQLCNVQDMLLEVCSVSSLIEKCQNKYDSNDQESTNSMFTTQKHGNCDTDTNSDEQCPSQTKRSKLDNKCYNSNSLKEEVKQNNNTTEGKNTKFDLIKASAQLNPTEQVCVSSFEKVQSSCGEKDIQSAELGGNKKTIPSCDERYILDIDLDYFSVTNPFLQDYTEEEYETLRNIYRVTFPSDKQNQDVLVNHVNENRKKIERLRQTIQWFASSEITGAEQANALECSKDEDLIQFLGKLKERKKEDIDYLMVHNAGMTTDLPHHISSDDEVDILLAELVTLIKILPKPALITIARSAIDEYCPPDQVDELEKKVLSVLKDVYQDLDVIFDYKDTSRVLTS